MSLKKSKKVLKKTIVSDIIKTNQTKMSEKLPREFFRFHFIHERVFTKKGAK